VTFSSRQICALQLRWLKQMKSANRNGMLISSINDRSSAPESRKFALLGGGVLEAKQKNPDAWLFGGVAPIASPQFVY